MLCIQPSTWLMYHESVFFQNWLCSFAVTIASALGIHSNLSFERNMSDYYTKLPFTSLGSVRVFDYFFFHIWKKLIFLYSINLYISHIVSISKFIYISQFVRFVHWMNQMSLKKICSFWSVLGKLLWKSN